MRGNLFLYSFLIISIFTTDIYSQFYFFGRNKVQYEKFEWQILKTEHFDIYYNSEFEEMAEIGAQFAEAAYKDLKVKFNNVVTRRIPLIFYNTHIHFQQTNITPGFIPEGVGGFFEFLKGRVVIPYLGSLEQFRHVIWHELVHVFMTNKVYNVLKDHRLPVDRLPPLWFIEGLAELWSTEWDTQADMVMRDVVLNNMFVGIKDIIKIYGTFLMYKEGQNFLQFVEKEYGEDKIILMLENFWRFTDFEELLEYVLGESIDTIDDKWAFSLKQEYFPLLTDNYPYHIKGNKITNEGYNFIPKFYNNNGNNEIYFLANRTGYSSLYKMILDEELKNVSDTEKLIEGEKEEIFESLHLFKPTLDVSNDGRILFASKGGASDVIHIYSIEDEKIIQTLEFDDVISIEGADFSYDGKKIVFSAIDLKGYTDIFIYDIENEILDRVTNDYYSDRDPIFNKQSNKIYFVSDRTEGMYKQKFNLFEYDLERNITNYVTYLDCNISKPQFNKDYSELYMNSDYDGTFNIWKLNRDNNNYTQSITQVTNFLTSALDFDFIDNEKIVVSGFEKFSFQFYIVDLEKSDSTIQNKTVEFNLSSAYNKWTAKRISLPSVKQKLEYEKDYALDYAISQVAADPVYGARGGALFTLSDLLSDDKYVFLLYNTAEIRNDILSNFNVALTRINSEHRTNYGYGIFHFSGRRYDIRESDEFFYERSFGGVFSLLYPFSKFQRLETSVSIANSDKELVDGLLTRKSLLVTNTISFVHDNSLWGPTGPLDGSRFRFLIGYTSDIKYSNVNYYSLIADYRYYFRLAFRSSIAFRASIFYNDGKEARRYFAGGSWDLRGWPRFGIRGEKLWLSSVELRYPLIDQFAIKFPFLGVGFSNIRGALFFDAGNAWDTNYGETLGSIGTGLRVNFLGFITFRYDIGKKIERNFTKLQPKLFYQFFFGWDF